jgi:hypothetical protein
MAEKDCAPGHSESIDDASSLAGDLSSFGRRTTSARQPSAEEGVELRGISEAPHHTVSAGTVFVYLHRQRKRPKRQTLDPDEIPERHKGLCFHYPDQNYYQVSPSVHDQGRRRSISLVNISATNQYRMIDLATHRCDVHYLSYVAGLTLVGWLSGRRRLLETGRIKNTQFNPHYWAFSKFDNAPRYGADKASVWNYQIKTWTP